MPYPNKRPPAFILVLAILSLLVYAGLTAAGNLRDLLPAYLAGHAVLLALMFLAWFRLRHSGDGMRLVLGAALLFRLVSAVGEPALSDDVYRYVWDGRVQLHGIHPYSFAPEDPALEHLRDSDWARINHPELKTIYPPLAQILFLVLAALGAGPVGFKLAMGLLDFGVVLALVRLLKKLGLPGDRAVLYAWNPLAVLETAGSGHIEPLAVLLVLLAALWIIEPRRSLSTAALAGAVQVKLLPAALLLGYARRLRNRHLLLLVLVLIVPALPYVISGPAVGAGLFDYAERWERNAFIYAGVERLMEWVDTGPLLKGWIAAAQQRFSADWVPWNFFYNHVWPRDIARAVVLLAAMAWIVHLAFRRRLGAVQETYLVLAGVLLLSPILHPWYLLWVLPFAVAFLSPGWLLLSLLVPLSYIGSESGVPWSVRCIEFLPSIALMVWSALGDRRRIPLPGKAGDPG